MRRFRFTASLIGLIFAITSVPDTAGPATAEASSAAQPTVGDTIELSGIGDGERLSVTLTRVVEPATPADEFDAAGSGNKLVGAQFRIRNIGTVAFSDAPDNDVELYGRTA